MKKPFLLQKKYDPNWTVGRCFVYWLWRVIWVGLSGCGIGLVSLVLGLGGYSPGLFRTYLETPVLLGLNLLVPVALAELFYALFRRTNWAFLLDAALILGFSAGNYFKLLFRDDPLMFGDLLLLREAGNMAGNYALALDRTLAFALCCVLAGFVFLTLLTPGKGKAREGRLFPALGLFTAAALVLSYPVYLDNSLYNGKAANYTNLDNMWSSTQQYIAHGFVYPFLHSISDAVETAPTGYTGAVAEAMAEAYPDADIPEEKKVNVVAIMLEAFQDFSRFGTPELAQDVYEGYHALEAESYTGNLVTNIFAGGTVDTERCFLTGYSVLPNFRGNVNAYPWYFQSQGYQTTGMHPCYQWFYNRENVNRYLGFQDYFFVENYFTDLTGGNVALDNIFFPELMKQLAQRQEGAPIFSFSVSYQGHGPYLSDRCLWGNADDYIPNDGTYTEEERNILANYFGSVQDTIEHLLELRDFLEAQEEPYVLVVFGDHDPWMGDGNSVYTAMGLNLDQSTQDGFMNYYSTRYLIWANSKAKETLDNDFVGEGPTIGPYFLMNELFRLCDWDGPGYLQALEPVMEQVPVHHSSGVYMENDRITPTLTAEGQALSQDYQWLQYYQRHHFRYNALIG